MRTNEHATRETRIREIENEFALFTQHAEAVKDFKLLFSEYAGLRQGRLEAMATRITQCPHAAEDVVQEAFVALHRRLTEERTDGNTGAWLTKVVRNIAIDHVRRVKTRQTVSFDSAHPSRSPSPHEACSEAEEAARIWGCIADLPDAQRRVIELRTLDGLSYKNIAAVLGISSANARLSHFRAILSLRNALFPET